MPWAKTILGLLCSDIVISSNDDDYWMLWQRYSAVSLENRKSFYNVTCIFVDFDHADLDYLRHCFCSQQLAHAQAGGVDSDSETPSFEDWNDASGSRFSRDGVVRPDRRARLAERCRSERRAP